MAIGLELVEQLLDLCPKTRDTGKKAGTYGPTLYTLARFRMNEPDAPLKSKSTHRGQHDTQGKSSGVASVASETVVS